MISLEFILHVKRQFQLLLLALHRLPGEVFIAAFLTEATFLSAPANGHHALSKYQ